MEDISHNVESLSSSCIQAGDDLLSAVVLPVLLGTSVAMLFLRVELCD